MYIKRTTPDKVNGKLVKYRKGDCLSLLCENGNYLGAIISDKYNAYYDITLIQYYQNQKPQMTDFINGKYFGTRFGSLEDIQYAVNYRMIKCKYIDSTNCIEKIGSIRLLAKLLQEGQDYLNTLQELHDFYIKELPIRIEKSRNAEKFPEIGFVSKHLIDVKCITDTTVR